MALAQIVLLVLYTLGSTRGQRRTECQLRGKMRIDVGEPPDESECVMQTEESGYFQCSTNELIHRKCMCNYHQFVASPTDRKAYCRYKDDIDFDTITCQDCKKLSLHGPCGDRGSYNCTKPLASDIKCNCKDGFTENYCDYKKVAMKCELSDAKKSTCDIDNLMINCTTHSKRANMFFLCHSFFNPQGSRLPLCADTKQPKEFTTEHSRQQEQNVGHRIEKDITVLFTVLVVLGRS